MTDDDLAAVLIVLPVILVFGVVSMICAYMICSDYLTGLPLYTVCAAIGFGTVIWVIRSPAFGPEPGTEPPR